MPLHRARPLESDDEYLEVRPEFASDLASQPLPYDVSEAVRKRGWIVPAYPMSPALQDTHVLRVVVRNGFGRDLAHTFVDDLGRAVDHLQAGGGRVDAGDRAGFHH